MDLLYFGHSALQITHNEISIIIDPLLSRNPCSNYNPKDIKVNYVLLTHAHHDHIGDAITIAEQNDAMIIAPYELAIYLGWKGLKTHPMGIGGSWDFEFGRVHLTYARHSSSYMDFEKKEIIYMGPSCGFLIEMDEKVIYFAGDTGLFSDMKLISERNAIDIAFLPIGNNYTMGQEDALIAAEWIHARTTVPMHYNSFPFLDQDPAKFISDLRQRDLNGIVMEPGTKLTL